MEKIKINKIIPFTCEAFDPEDKSLGFLNEYEFNDLRIQIMKNQVEGYYMKYNDEDLHIDHDGRINHWPKGFYDLLETQYIELIGWKR